MAQTLLLSTSAVAGERVACQSEVMRDPGDDTRLSYRTKVDGRPERCFYLGPPMKPRSELYWEHRPESIMPGMVEQPGSTAVPGLQPPQKEVMDDESFDGQAVGRARNKTTPSSLDEAGANFHERWEGGR